MVTKANAHISLNALFFNEVDSMLETGNSITNHRFIGPHRVALF